MKAITIKQPWASLIVEGIKDVENRNWKCPEKYIGKRVLIHAGMTNVRGDWMYKQPIRKYWKDLASLAGISDNEMRDAMCKTYPQILGAIIGSVQIVDCVINHQSVWAEQTSRMSPENIYNWVLANPIKFDTPIPCKGKLRFWESRVDLIVCPKCGNVCIHHWKETIDRYVHNCEHCHYWITESEFKVY